MIPSPSDFLAQSQMCAYRLRIEAMGFRFRYVSLTEDNQWASPGERSPYYLFRGRLDCLCGRVEDFRYAIERCQPMPFRPFQYLYDRDALSITHLIEDGLPESLLAIARAIAKDARW